MTKLTEPHRCTLPKPRRRWLDVVAACSRCGELWVLRCTTRVPDSDMSSWSGGPVVQWFRLDDDRRQLRRQLEQC